MTRRLTVLFASLEGALAVAIGVAIPLVPLTIDVGGAVRVRDRTG